MKNKKLTTLISALCLISFVIGASLVFVLKAQTASTFWITEGLYPSATSLTVWRDGSYYFGKNGYGQILYSGTNATLVIQNCIDNLAGGTIFVSAGIYSLSTGININKNDISIQGEGTATIFDLGTNGITAFTFYSSITPAHRWRSGLKNMRIDATNRPVNSKGLNVTNHNLFRLENVFINQMETGMSLNTSFYGEYSGLNIYNCTLGLDLGYASSTTFYGLFTIHCTTGVDTSAGSGAITFIKPNVEYCTNGMVFDRGMHGMTINGGYFGNINGTALLLSGLDNTYPSEGCLIDSGDYLLNDINIEIRYVNGSEIRGIYSTQSTTCGIRIHASAKNVSINHNKFEDSTPLNITSSHTLFFENNVGYTTENSGSASLATGATVTHGLAGTPTCVLLTNSVSEDTWVTAIGATTFAVNFDGGGTQTVYWYAEFQP